MSTRVWESAVLPYPTPAVWSKLRTLDFAAILPSRVASSELVYGRCPDEGELRAGHRWLQAGMRRAPSALCVRDPLPLVACLPQSALSAASRTRTAPCGP